jgi:hypothetical protein
MHSHNVNNLTRFISVDLQYDFTRAKGLHYNPKRTSVHFVRNILIPFFREKEVKIGEIISDYRQPRPGDEDDSCRPGEWGYTSEIPSELVTTQWVKCLNSPLFTRKNIGIAKRKPGLPKPDAEAFYRWMTPQGGTHLGKRTIVVFGLTLDCCVLCTVQALRFDGYNVKILMEATDTYQGGQKSKKEAMRFVSNWADPVTFNEVQKFVESDNALERMANYDTNPL